MNNHDLCLLSVISSFFIASNILPFVGLPIITGILGLLKPKLGWKKVYAFCWFLIIYALLCYPNVAIWGIEFLSLPIFILGCFNASLQFLYLSMYVNRKFKNWVIR